MLNMALAGHLGMVVGVEVVAVRGMCVLGCFGVMALLMGLGGMTMMLRGMLVMLGGLFVMFGDLVRVRHFFISHACADRLSAHAWV
jgi:hypothetical protein